LYRFLLREAYHKNHLIGETPVEIVLRINLSGWDVESTISIQLNNYLIGTHNNIYYLYYLLNTGKSIFSSNHYVNLEI